MRRRLLDHTYKKTVTGNPAIAKSVARMYPDISFPGKTEQQQTTGAQLFDVSNAIPERFISNGNISVTTGRNMIYKSNVIKPNTQYAYSALNNVTVSIFEYNSSDEFIKRTNGDGINVTTSENTSWAYIALVGSIDDIDEAKDNFVFCEGATALHWEPYTGGKPSPSPEYPQDIVNAQPPVQVEISDGGDNVQTVTITSDRPITKWDKLIKQDGVWGWLYKSNEVEFDGSGDESWSKFTSKNIFYIAKNDMKMGSSMEGWCDKFENIGNADETGVKFGGGNAVIYFNKMGDYANDLPGWKTWLQSNPIKVLYETENTEFVPLTQEEQNMLNALHTNNPTTVVQNSINTDVTLTYKTKRSLEVTQ